MKQLTEEKKATSLVQVEMPHSLSQLLGLVAEKNPFVLYAGGTLAGGELASCLFKESATRIITLREVKELSEVHLTERHLYLGAMTTFSRVLELPSRILPSSLRMGLLDMGSLAVRNLATMGGHLCHRKITPLLPILAALEARVELRRQKRGGHKKFVTRWVPCSQLVSENGEPTLTSGELLTRVRLSRKPWTYHTYKREGSLIFCGLASLDREGRIVDLRMVFGDPNLNRILRFPLQEVSLLGLEVPLSEEKKERTGDLVGHHFLQAKMDERQVDVGVGLLNRFLAILGLQSSPWWSGVAIDPSPGQALS